MDGLVCKALQIPFVPCYICGRFGVNLYKIGSDFLNIGRAESSNFSE